MHSLKKATKKQLEEQLLSMQQQLDQAQAKIADLETSVTEYEDRAIKDDNRILELERQLAVAHEIVRGQREEKLANPATATPPPGGHCPEALMPEKEGVMKLWAMLSNEGYGIRLIHIGKDGLGWSMTKASDSTVYHLFEPIQGPMTCDCPGATRHGPLCAGGKGCKHCRIIKAIRGVVGS
jgi:hypothetical protein